MPFMISPISHLFGKIISLFELKNLHGTYNQEVLGSPSAAEKSFKVQKIIKGLQPSPCHASCSVRPYSGSAVESALESCSLRSAKGEMQARSMNKFWVNGERRIESRWEVGWLSIISLCVCAFSDCKCTSNGKKTVGARRSTRAGTIAEVEVRRLFVNLCGRS